MTRSLAHLRDIFHAIDRVFYFGALAADGVTVKWMRFRPSKRDIRLGCYRPSTMTIEISPILAHDFVPEYVVAGTVFHESLHYAHGPHHTEAFLVAEQQYPYLDEDLQWQRDNHAALIAARPPKRGAP